MVVPSNEMGSRWCWVNQVVAAWGCKVADLEVFVLWMTC